ncbi:hypothetical protein AB0Y14_11910, partial [Rothia sp. HC945]|uniref:hypothetical protein n=1 Tax=Rothia sp. HC945 TaxID=3171170 RepID=UPI003F21F88F
LKPTRIQKTWYNIQTKHTIEFSNNKPHTNQPHTKMRKNQCRSHHHENHRGNFSNLPEPNPARKPNPNPTPPDPPEHDTQPHPAHQAKE